jgi:hypothetical protein
LNLPQEAILEFKKLYQLKTGRNLSVAESEEMAQELLTLYALSQDQQQIL